MSGKEDEARSPNARNEDTPLYKRVTDSAKGLSRDAVSTRGGLPQLPGADKAAGPSSSNGLHEAERDASNVYDRPQGQPNYDTFRSIDDESQQSTLQNERDFDMFHHNSGNDAFQVDFQDRWNKGKGRAIDQNGGTFDRVWQEPRGSDEGVHIYPFREPDGQAVSDLLSDPSFQPQFDYDHLGNAESGDGFSPDFSIPQDQQVTAGKIKASLPQPPVHRAPSPMNPLALLPDFNNGLQDSQSPWVELASRYQDEVWGDALRPLREAAQKELNEVQSPKGEGYSGHEGPAVRRLNMVLRHLQVDHVDQPEPGRARDWVQDAVRKVEKEFTSARMEGHW